jgi:hypothetical protein
MLLPPAVDDFAPALRPAPVWHKPGGGRLQRPRLSPEEPPPPGEAIGARIPQERRPELGQKEVLAQFILVPRHKPDEDCKSFRGPCRWRKSSKIMKPADSKRNLKAG